MPFVSKAIGVPLAKMACRLMLGETHRRRSACPRTRWPHAHVAVKEAVLPFDRFDGARRDARAGDALDRRGHGRRARLPDGVRQGAGRGRRRRFPTSGTVFITVTDRDKPGAVAIAQTLHDLGFTIVATGGTKAALERMGVPASLLQKVGEGSPNVVDVIEGGDVTLVVNTPTGSGARSDGWEIRRAAIKRGVPCLTTLSGGLAAVRAIAAARQGEAEVLSLQEIHRPSRAVEADGVNLPPAGIAERPATPLARRALRVDGRRRARGVRRPERRGSGRPGAAPGAVLHARRRRSAGGEGTASGPCSRGPFSVLRAHAGPALRLDFMLEAVGPGTSRLCELRPGDGLYVLGPLGVGFTAPTDARRPLLVRWRRRQRRPWRCSRTRCSTRACRRRRCWGSATRTTPRAQRSWPGRRSRPTTAASVTTAS